MYSYHALPHNYALPHITTTAKIKHNVNKNNVHSKNIKDKRKITCNKNELTVVNKKTHHMYI